MKDLEKIFYDPNTGFINTKELYRRAREEGLNYKMKDIKDWYDKQVVNQVYKKPVKVKNYNRIRSHYFQVGEMQADLIMDLSKSSEYNRKFKFILNL